MSSALDLGRFISGGTLRVWLTNRQGRNLADFALGTSTGVQEINANLRISPNLHYITNPDQLASPFRTQRVGNVLAIGLRFAVEVPLIQASRGSEAARD